MIQFNRLQRWEFLQRRPFSGKREGAIALIFSLLWFLGIWLRLSSGEVGEWTTGEKLWEAISFVVFGAIPIFGLATPLGEKFAKKILLPNQGLGFQLLLCLLLGGFVSIAKILTFNPTHFDGIQQLHHLFLPNQFWLNTLFWLGGVFIAARIPFVMLAQRQVSARPLQSLLQSRSFILCLSLNTLYLLALHTNLFGLHPQQNSFEGYWMSLLYGLVCLGMTWFSSSPGWTRQGRNQQQQRTTPFDFFLILLSVGILYWLSVPSFRFGVCVGVDLFIVAVIYGTGLSRDHFGYSFQLRWRDVRVFLSTILVAALVLIPPALLTGFVKPTALSSTLNVWRLISFFLLFSFRVGVFEEIFFRAGLMVLIRDRFPLKTHPQTVVLMSAFISSLIFGLVHIGNEPGATSTLAPWQYKSVYIVMATLASLFYSLAFGVTNRLTASIWIHGFVDTTAVVLLGGFLAVPF